jgi:hypothetical protein
MRRNVKVGDRIKFRSPTRVSDRTVTRKVVSLDPLGRPCVVYEGWSDFVVRWDEVQEVLPCD